MAATARHGGGSLPAEFGSQFAVELTGATYRQVDRWAAAGLLGEAHQGLGTGYRRRFDDVDLEVLFGLARLADLGATAPFLAVAADAARLRRVDSPGELLAVRLDTVPARLPLDASVPAAFAAAGAWMVTLVPFGPERRTREHPVPCCWCRDDAWADDAVCDAPRCRTRQAHHLAQIARRRAS